MKHRVHWCKLCQDDFIPSDEIVKCIECPKRFHKECLEYERAENNELSPLDVSTYKCEDCQKYSEEIAIENDERCKICKEINQENLLYCDGCPNSYHLACLNLENEPDTEHWYCPMCRPQDHKENEIRRLNRRSFVQDPSEHVNSTICYVCQRHGKLLGCDFCTNSFHHSCLLDFEFDFSGDVWECPCCKGEDPLLNQAHKRWTRQQMEEVIAERKKLIAQWRPKINKYRTRFLLAHKNHITAFVSNKVLANLTRALSNEAVQSRKKLKQKRDIDTILEQLEEEGRYESMKFVKKTLKAVYYPSGRKMEGRPLREGTVLKPHQKDGVKWLLKSFLNGGAILADDMGLGKTIQTLCFLSYLNAIKIGGPHLIVVPLSTVGNWLREVHKFTPHLSCIKICGSRSERLHAMEDRLSCRGLYDLYITTYETIKNEEGFFVETIPHWQCLILDEAHRIKNHSTASRHSMDRITCNMRLLLTGTPLQNNAFELFTLINFLFPDVFKDSEVMEQAFKYKTKQNEIELDTVLPPEDLESIRILLSKIMLRRLKEQTISLPDKIFNEIWLPLSDTATFFYKYFIQVRNSSNEGLSFRKLLGLVIKMRILCGHPRGIVGRTSQFDKLCTFLDLDRDSPETKDLKTEFYSKSQELRDTDGENHILASSKLIFLDKLLQQLHYENCTYVPHYKPMISTHFRETLKHKTKAPSKMTLQEIKALQPGYIVEPQPTSTNRSLFVEDMLPSKYTQNCPYQPVINELSDINIDVELDEVYSPTSSAGSASDGEAEESNQESKIGDEESVSPKKSSRSHTMHKMLIFTQFQLVLDELERYCKYRGWKYMRLDGSTNKLIRELDIREFNSNDSPYFIYLISTRAGGLGINLTSANHVVLYDEDWNPFVDMQAIDRAHRIGQKRNVHIWKLITEWTVEERMAFRRDQKLKLDKLIMQYEEEMLDSKDIPQETLSPAEIINMLMHGRLAIMTMERENITGYTLDKCLERQRQKPNVPEDDTVLSTIGDMSTNISVSTAIQEEEDIPIAYPSGDQADGSTASDFTEANRDEFITQLKDAGILWRSDRDRKKPTLMYVPDIWAKKSTTKLMKHEPRCFSCGHPKNYKCKYTDKNGDAVEVDYGELYHCFRCPKSYHRFCENLSDVQRKTWTCRWHECCLCFRKSSQCGNLLIHCSSCPTSFCYDCFPPDYKRHYVDEAYYTQLNSRGMSANPTNWIFFFCSKCKAFQEQKKKRRISKMEKELRSTQQKELRMKLKSSKISDKDFIEHKKKIDDMDLELEQELRNGYQSLFPKVFLDELQMRIDRDKQIALAESAKEPPEKVKTEPGAENVEKKKSRKTSTFSNSRMPCKVVSLCDNCKMFGHNVPKYPSECVFPLEFGKSPVEVGKNVDGVVKKLVRASCFKCKALYLGKSAHARKHCKSLTPEELSEYDARREGQRRILEEIKKREPLTCPDTVNLMSLGVFKSLYTNLIIKADTIMESCIIAAGMGYTLSERRTRKKPEVKIKPEDGPNIKQEEEVYPTTETSAISSFASAMLNSNVGQMFNFNSSIKPLPTNLLPPLP